MSEPAQTTLTLHSSLAAFMPLVIAALLCSALLALRVACVCRLRACTCAPLACVCAAMSHSARFPPCVLCSAPLCFLTCSRSLSLSLTHFRFGERVGEVPSIARLCYRGLR